MTPNMSKAAIRENASVEVITGPPPAKEFLAREDHSQGVPGADRLAVSLEMVEWLTANVRPISARASPASLRTSASRR